MQAAYQKLLSIQAGSATILALQLCAMQVPPSFHLPWPDSEDKLKRTASDKSYLRMNNFRSRLCWHDAYESNSEDF